MHAMGLFIFDVFLLGGIMVIAWVIFAIWLVALVLKTIFRAFGLIGRAIIPVGAIGGGAGMRQSDRQGVRPCNRIRCGAANPASAKFCRRCGAPLGNPVRSRVAA
jgi:hypothetical protein